MDYKLDKVNKKILYELSKNSKISDSKLAKKVLKSKESVRHRIKKLTKDKIILRSTIWIDPTRLGYKTTKIYLKLANIPKKKEKFIEFVKKDKRLFWLGIAEGSWNAGLTFFVKTDKEFFKLKNELITRFKDLIIESQIGIIVEVYAGERKFLSEESSNWTKLFGEFDTKSLDETSINIIKELSQNSRINITSIANKYKTTVDIIRNRIKKLEREKIIARYTIDINYQKLGYEFYKTFIYFKNITEEDLEKLFEYARNNKNIINIVKQISPWDIELEIMCRSYQEYNNIISETTLKFAKIINRIETAIINEDYVFPCRKMLLEK